MKNPIFILILSLPSFILPDQWIDISSSEEEAPSINIVSSEIENTIVEFNLAGFNQKSVYINDNEYLIISFPTSASNLESGYPDIPSVSKSIIIPNNGLMKTEILGVEYIEYDNILIAPSKGNISREINPSSIDYFFNDIYLSDTYYPENGVNLREPYVLRDFRGQAITFYPFSYNAVDKKLKVFTYLKVRVYNDGIDNRNILNDKNITTIDKEYKNIYQNQFLNFNEDIRFDYLEDQGSMLIISYGGFMETMNPLVEWKNIKGVPTEMVDVASIGSNTSSIESYVSDYYNNNNLTFLLLVGDIAQIPSPSVSGSPSDVSYGCILGNDFYPEVIVGRFSGSTPSHIETQVERSVEYERYPQSGAEWYDNALGVASDQGPGFGGYTDDDFNDFLWETVLSGFTYDNYEGIYDGSGGTDAQGIAAINNGVSIINYTGHGSISSWGNGASLSSSQINSLTNDNLLPFVITVGCNVGEFQSTNECFCEAWQRATNNGEPTGSIAHFGSTISQSWEPPMHGQYGMNLILTESYDDHLTRSIGGIATNGCMYMNDAQGSSGINETQYWTLFGDPSVNIRTAPPTNLSAVHDDIIIIGQSEFVVDVGEDGALVALSRDGELLASSYSVGGVAILELNDDISGTPGDLNLIATGFNTFPYETSITVIAPEGAYVVIDNVEVNSNSNFDGSVTYGDEIEFYLNISNVGSDPVNGLDVSLSTNDSYIELNSSFESFGLYIAPGNSGQIGPFNFSVDSNVPNQHQIELNCDISDNSDTWNSIIYFTANAPEITINNIDGNLTPGQSTTISVDLSNIGGAPINYPVVAANGDMYVTVNNSGIGNAYYWDYLLENNQETLDIQVSVNSSTPIGHIVEFSISVTNLDGGLNQSLTFMLPVGQFTETFENDFSELIDWSFSGNANWQIAEDEQHNGLYSAKSGDIIDSESTSLSITLDVVMDNQIDFYYKVASEYSPSGLYFYDGLEFYIDNVLQSQLQPTSDGQSPWTLASYPVDAGTRIFTWTYVKDDGEGTTDIEADCSWIDDIIFPPFAINYGSLLGDVNGDEMVSILDIILMINMVLDYEEDQDSADINGDEVINVMDIILAVNIILDF
jgi:hypothetical protein